MKPTARNQRNRYIKRSIRPFKSAVAISGARSSNRNSNSRDKKQEKEKIRGAMVTIRQGAAPGHIIYGRMKVGGIYTFAAENKNSSRAYGRSGEDDYQIVWIAKAGGPTGNDISITIVVSGTHSTLDISVEDKAIEIRLKSSGSSSRSRANEVIDAVNAHPEASQLVSCHKGEGKGTSYVESVSEFFLKEGGGTHLHHLITVAAHEIQWVEKIIFDNREVVFGFNGDPKKSKGWFVRKEKDGTDTSLVYRAINNGTDDQEVLPDLVANLPHRFTSRHRQRGCAHVYLVTIWDEKRFAQGIPDISFLIRGKPVYDPRTGGSSPTANAALVIADYLTNDKWGLGVPYSSIDETALIAAANECDEIIELADGGTERRYQIHGGFDSSFPPIKVLDEMANAIAGDIVYQAGKWRILPGKWRAPTQYFSNDDTRGVVTVTTRKSRSDTFNCVRGTIASYEDDYEDVDYPSVKVRTYIQEDGRNIWLDLPFSLVTSPYQAQRIAKIRLGQIRQQISIDCSFTLKALNLQIGDVIYYTDPTYGWTNKQFEVREWSVQEDGTYGMIVKVVLDETAELVYTWEKADELKTDPAPDTEFPSHNDVDAPTNVLLESGTEHLYIREDGTVFTRVRVAWTESGTIYVRNGGQYEVRYKKSSSAVWSQAMKLSADFNYAYILDVQDGVQYDVAVRAVSALGVPSDWTEVLAYTVIGKTAPPSDVSLFNSKIESYGIQLEWSSVVDLDVQEYEIRLGGTSWETASFLFRGRGTNYRSDMRIVGTYVFRIKAVDTTGNYSVNDRTTSQIITSPQAPIVDGTITDANVVLSWTVPTSLFAIDSYEVAYGDTFASRIVVGTIKATSLSRQVDWNGNQTWWVTAFDVAGNRGVAGSRVVSIAAPSGVLNLGNEVIDSNVKLDWDAPATGALPISHYVIKKGDDFVTATTIGQVSATFSLIFETVGGTFTYWVTAIDSAGNEGAAISTTAIVSNPPDLVIVADNDLDLTTFQLANMAVVGDKLLGPVDPTETWTSHFVNNSFSSPQAQINAGYPLYPQPGPSWCGAQKVVDFGALLPQGFIKVQMNTTLLSGTPSVSVRLWYSANNSTWYGGDVGETITAAYAFRYLKIRLSYGTVPNGTFS